MRKIWMLAAVLVVAAGCEDKSDPTEVEAGADVTYSLIALESPYGPNYEFLQPASCGRMLRSSITAGTLKFLPGGEWEMDLDAWQEVEGDEAVACPAFTTVDISTTVTGTYTESATGAPVQLRLDNGDVLGNATGLGPVYPTTITVNVTGHANLGPAIPFDALMPSTWARTDLE